MNKDISFKAIALRSFVYKSNHRRIELITENNEIISALYYKRKKNSSFTVPISGVFYLTRTKDQYPYVIKDFDLVYDYNFIYKNFEKLNSYNIWANILKKIKDQGRYYNLLKASFSLLEHYDAKKIDILFLLSIIKEQGWSFNLYNCPLCNYKYLDIDIIYYNSNNLTNCCKNCSENTSNLYLPPNARKYLKLYHHQDITKVLDLEINDNTLTSIHRYLTRYVYFLLNGGINYDKFGML